MPYENFISEQFKIFKNVKIFPEAQKDSFPQNATGSGSRQLPGKSNQNAQNRNEKQNSPAAYLLNCNPGTTLSILQGMFFVWRRQFIPGHQIFAQSGLSILGCLERKKHILLPACEMSWEKRDWNFILVTCARPDFFFSFF